MAPRFAPVLASLIFLACSSPSPASSGGGGEGGSSTTTGGSGAGGAGAQGSGASGAGGDGGGTTSAGGAGGGTTSQGGGAQGGGGGAPPLDCTQLPDGTTCEGTGTCCGGTCRTDYTDDPANCGACGHDCMGGGCADSQCQPVIVASNLNESFSLDQDATHVYFSQYAGGVVNQGSTRRVVKATGQVEDVITSGWGNVALGIEQGTLFQAVTHPDGVSAVYRGDPANYLATFTTVFSGGAGTLAGGVNYGHLGHSVTTISFLTKNAVYQANISNNAYQQVDTSSTDYSFTDTILDATRVYWLDQTSGKVRARLASAVPNALASFDLVTGQTGAKGLAQSSTEVFWTITDANVNPAIGVYRAPKSNSLVTPTTVIASVDAHKLAVDGTTVFWVTGISGKLESCELANCAPTRKTLASFTGRGNDILVDAEAIYYLGDNGATLYRVAR